MEASRVLRCELASKEDADHSIKIEKRYVAKDIIGN